MLLGLVFQVVRNPGKVRLHKRQSLVNVVPVHRGVELRHKTAASYLLVFVLCQQSLREADFDFFVRVTQSVEMQISVILFDGQIACLIEHRKRVVADFR